MFTHSLRPHHGDRTAVVDRGSASLNGTVLTPEQVFIGRGGHHPDDVPFDIVRVGT